MLNRRDNVEPCHTNTCQWILELEKFQFWRSEPRGLLWIKGKPGAGKSTLMSFLHKKLGSSQKDNQGIQLDFFFTARGTEMQRTPLGMFRSLLNQIFLYDATIRSQVREAYEHRCKLFGWEEGIWTWPQTMLEELLVDTVLSSRQRVTIFVDALDETGDVSAPQIASFFHQLLDRAERKNAAIRICISCRHYPIICSTQTLEIHVEHHNGKDIATYIRDILAQIEVEDSLSEDTRQVLIKRLTQQANGVFQWVRLIMPLTRRRIHEGETSEDICSWLHEVPDGLEDVYRYILKEVIDVRNLKQSFSLFQWLSVAERPLALKEIRYALVAGDAQITGALKPIEKIHGFVESDKRMKIRINVLSGGLAEVVSSKDSDEFVQVVHQSVNEFLRAKGLAMMSDMLGTSSPTRKNEEIYFQSHAVLYRTCLIYLMIHFLRGGFPRELHETKSELIRNHPLLDYATHNVFFHAEKAAHCRRLRSLDEEYILSKVVTHWVQLYQSLDVFNPLCPPSGARLIHIAAAANLVDILERVSLDDSECAMSDKFGNTAFHFAARCGHISAGTILLHKGNDFKVENELKMTPLTVAASYGHMDFVKWLICEGVHLEDTMGDAHSALQNASRQGHQNVVELLIGAGANVNAQGGEYGNALQAACAGGSNSEIVKILLGAGADVNAQGGQHGTALRAACAEGGSSEIVQLLLDAGADVNLQYDQHGPALNACARSSRGGRTLGGYISSQDMTDQEIVRLLLSAGADVNAQGGEYGTALQTYANAADSHIIRILLDAGADVNAQGGRYGTALQAAGRENGRQEIIQMLLEAGADVNIQAGFYGTALQAASQGRGNCKSVRMLLDAGADVNTKGGYYGTALQAACAKNHDDENVEMLLDAGADVNAQGGRYGFALQGACRFQETSRIAQILLRAGADVNAQGGDYRTALQAACRNRRDNGMVKIILDAGADVNAQGGEFGSALLAAVFCGHLDRIEVLLRAGANPSLVDRLGQTPLHVAASENMLTVLHRFPVFLSSINVRDKLLRSPIHLAICLGHIDFATHLLQFFTDPFLLDGYGRNILDWAVGNKSLVRQIRTHHPSIVTTPKEIQARVVCQSIMELSKMLQTQPDFLWPLIQQLGRYLLFVNNLDDARFLLQLHLSQRGSPAGASFTIYCVICDDNIEQSRFVCRECAHMDLCSYCVENEEFHSRLHPNQAHVTFELTEVQGAGPQFAELELATYRKVLDRLSTEGPSNHSAANLFFHVTSRTMIDVLPRGLLGLIPMFCVLLVGILAVLWGH